MRTKGLNQNKINIVTLGCSKNIYDSEVLMRQLQAGKYNVKHEEKNSDAATVIINTCGFIDNAKEESINTILQYVAAKKQGLVNKLIVTGCLSERYKTDLEKEIPEVDAYFGTKELPRLLKILKTDYKKELIGERLLTTPIHYAYFKIAEGCDRPCAFCAIPLMRGKHISTPIEQLVKNAKSLAAQGVKELILIAQDLTYYGLDIYKQRKLADLLDALSDIEGIEWIRLHYAFPSGFPMEVIDVMSRKPNICNYLDIPLQHASDNMLKAMRRGITKEKTIRLINEIKNKNPDIAIRTTLISGFPGETEADFETLYHFVEEMKFDRLGVFTYSHEENTHAYNFNDDVPQEIKEQRAEGIMDLQQGISFVQNQDKVGKEYKVLIDKIESGYYVGRTEFDSPEVDNEVLIPLNDDYHLPAGQFVNAKITRAEAFDLFAIPV